MKVFACFSLWCYRIRYRFYLCLDGVSRITGSLFEGARIALRARMSHPATKQRPPIGVMAPSQRTPVMDSRYRLPEKTTIPATNSHPEAEIHVFGHRVVAQATASSASPWTKWYRTPVSKTASISGVTRPRSPWAPKAPRSTPNPHVTAPAANQLATMPRIIHGESPQYWVIVV